MEFSTVVIVGSGSKQQESTDPYVTNGEIGNAKTGQGKFSDLEGNPGADNIQRHRVEQAPSAQFQKNPPGAESGHGHSPPTLRNPIRNTGDHGWRVLNKNNFFGLG
jgi:hypothetical protein